MSSSVLFDAPGPKARRRQLIGSIVGGVFVAAIVAVILWRLNAKDQLDGAKWSPFKDAGIWQHALWPGIRATLEAAALSIVFAIVVGALLAVGRLSDRRWLRRPAGLVVEFFRATPLLLLILFLFLITNGDIGRLWPLVLALTLYNGSVLAETFRAGMLAVPRGQSEAAYAVGMGKGQVMRLILLPQAITAMLPAIIGQCVVCLKDTSLGYVIGYEELIRNGNRIGEGYNNILPTAIVLAAMYIVINYSLSRIARYLEARLRRKGRTTRAAPTVQATELENA